MTLQQMRYLLAIADCRSISAAAAALYVAQPSLSEALREVEREYGITVFTRTNRGVVPTAEGLELISMVRRVVQLDDLIAERFNAAAGESGPERLTVSSQRYAFVTEAVAAMIQARGERGFAFALRETDTEEIFTDVRSLKCDVGVLCITSQNESIITREVDRAGLTFTSLFTTKPAVVMAKSHPLASASKVKPAALSDYPRVMFEQGDGASAYYYEDPLPEAPRRSVVTVRDRASLNALLSLTDAYAIGTGARTEGLNPSIVSVPLDTPEVMTVGLLENPRVNRRPLTEEFVQRLNSLVQDTAIG